MKRYYSANDYMKEIFGEKVYKLALDGGMTCPNRDGKIGTGGCIFCSESGSGDFAAKRCESISKQIDNAIEILGKKGRGLKYIAYFQSYTNTYAEADYLEKLFSETVSDERIVALSVATRPDCLGDDVMAVLKKVREKKPLWVELGLQTADEKIAEYIRRGYKNEVYEKACEKLHKIGAVVITHQIIGLPHESTDGMVSTARYIAKHSDGIKLQLLHVLKNTDLYHEYEKGNVPYLTLDEYIAILEKIIEALPENTVIHRLTGDGAKKELVSPLWSADKKRVLNGINAAFERDNIIQGKNFNI